MSHRYAFALTLWLAMTGIAQADFRLRYVAIQGHGDLGSLILTNGKLRAEPDHQNSANFDASSSAILDLVNANLVLLNHTQHRYTRFDSESLGQVAGIARLVGVQDGLQLRVQANGTREQVAGYACTVYRIDLNGEHYADYCMADANQLGLSAADRASLKRSMEIAQTLLNHIGGNVSASVFAADRLPTKWVSYRDGKVIGISELRSVGVAKIAASEVAIPSNYREQAIDPSLFAPD